MTEPKINPLTGHEDGLPDPRPRHEIWQELLATHQMNPDTRLSDIYYALSLILKDLEPFVDAEIEELVRQRRLEEQRFKKATAKQ